MIQQESITLLGDDFDLYWQVQFIKFLEAFAFLVAIQATRKVDDISVIGLESLSNSV